MRRHALALALAAGCAGDDDARSIDFLSPGTEVPLEAGADLEVYLRPQGAWGTEVDVHVLGVEKDELAKFAIEVLSEAGEELALQPFLPTSTARELDGGCVAIAGLPIVFHDGVPAEAIDGEPATLRAEMETDPPAEGELAVVLRRVD